jgi:hypothetical protein
MRRLAAVLVLAALVGLTAASPVWAKAYTFKLHRAGSINGTQLAAGMYQLELNGQEEAVISRNGERIATTRVEVKPLSNGTSGGSVLQAADGSIREIRLKDQVVVLAR